MTDANGCISSDDVAITVQTLEETIDDLIGDIEDLVDSDVLNPGQGNALIVKLLSALMKIEQGQPQVAVNKLQAFINQVNAFINTGKLTPEQGQALIDAAQAIIDVLASSARIAGAGQQASEVVQVLEDVPEEYGLAQNYPKAIPEK